MMVCDFFRVGALKLQPVGQIQLADHSCLETHRAMVFF